MDTHSTHTVSSAAVVDDNEGSVVLVVDTPPELLCVDDDDDDDDDDGDDDGKMPTPDGAEVGADVVGARTTMTGVGATTGEAVGDVEGGADGALLLGEVVVRTAADGDVDTVGVNVGAPPSGPSTDASPLPMPLPLAPSPTRSSPSVSVASVGAGVGLDNAKLRIVM